MKKYIILEPSAIDFWKSVVIGFLLKCRFAVGIGIGFGIEKSCRFFKKKVCSCLFLGQTAISLVFFELQKLF
jgi:hypothetical protein